MTTEEKIEKKRKYDRELKRRLRRERPEYYRNLQKQWIEKNKEHSQKQRHNWYLENRERILRAKKEQYANDGGRLREQQKVWRRANRDKGTIYERRWAEKGGRYINAQYRKKRLANDPVFRLRSNFSIAICNVLAGREGKQWRHWEDLVGYSLTNLKSHLEKKFDDKMSWDNYGSYWHLDHIRPVASFNFTSVNDDDFKKCWALENLQPLEKHANFVKSDWYIYA